MTEFAAQDKNVLSCAVEATGIASGKNGNMSKTVRFK